MATIAQRISELLFDYDCIIVPELGGFITNYKPAYIDEHLGVLYPPSKALGFNRQLINNDGLLANYIAREDLISFENACENIKSEVEICFEKLNEGKRVEFDKVGILYMDSENKIHFDPDDSINYLTSSFGLHKYYYPQLSESLKVVPAKNDATKVEPVTPVIQLDPLQKEDPNEIVHIATARSSNFKYWVAAALIPLLLYVGLVTWQSDFINDRTVHKTDFNPFKILKAKKYDVRQNSEFVLKEVEVAPFVAPEKVEKLPEELNENKEKILISSKLPFNIAEHGLYANTEIAAYRYHVINGCFSVKTNAEKQTNRLREKGFTAYIIDKKGKLYRVSQGSFNNKQDALKLLRQARINENKDSWLLKK